MDTANYVNQVGALINDSTKYTVDIDESSVENISVIYYLNELLTSLSTIYSTLPEDFKELYTEEYIQKKLEAYIHCLKKETNFYANKEIDEDCVLTELDGHIRLESIL